MYLNRQNIELINKVKAKAKGRGLTVAQTNSRLDGNYLVAVRIYKKASDKGHPTKAIYTLRTPADFKKYLGK